MSLPTVTIIVADNGATAAIQLPQQNVQVKIGCAIGATANVPIAASQPATILSNLTGGPLCEASGLVCAAGGVAIAVPIPIVTIGAATAVVATVPGGSASVMTVTLDGTYGAYDDFFVMVRVITSGTRGTAGVQIQISLDAGRNWGPVLNLGTAVTLAIPRTGITLAFAAGSLVAGDYFRFSTTAPAGNDAGVSAAIAALGASQYAIAGWGSMHIVAGLGGAPAASVTNYQTYAETLATSRYVYTRAITDARDALAPVAWGGSGETEAVWMSALATAFGSTSAIRLCVGGGAYNTPSAFPNAYGGTPSYRRPIGWSAAVRRVLIPPQRRGGRVKDGALANIVVDPSRDPADGFIYHDERAVPGLDTARFLSAITWPKKSSGFYVCHENLMAPNGSQFTELPIGNVIDVACDIAYAEGVEEISDDLRLTNTGTLYPTDALTYQSTIDGQLTADMTNVAMCSAAWCSVSQTANVFATKNIPIGVNVIPRGYVDAITATINLVP